MTRDFGATVPASDASYDPDATVTLAPETRQRLLAQAFATRASDEETTLRMTAPAMLAGIPSPLGDEPPASGDRPVRWSRPAHAPASIVFVPGRARVLAAFAFGLAVVSALAVLVLY